MPSASAGSSSTTAATAIGATVGRSWCSSRAAARTRATTAASAVSGDAGGTATRGSSRPSSPGSTGPRASRSINFADENPTAARARLAGLPGSAHRRECPSDAGRLHPGRRHRPRRGHPAPVQEGRRGPVSARHRELRRRDAAQDPQGRNHRPGPRGDPPAAPARYPLDGDLCRRVRRGDGRRLLARPAATALLRPGPDPVAVRHAAPLDAVFLRGRPTDGSSRRTSPSGTTSIRCWPAGTCRPGASCCG